MKSIRLLIAGGLVFAGLSTASAGSRLVTNLKAGKPQTVLVYGTSLTAGGAWVPQLLQSLKQAFSNQVTLINGARSGMNSEWGLANVEEKVIRKKPDTVFIEFAINDAVERFYISVEEARENLEQMIDRIRAARPDTEIILMTMNTSTSGRRRLSDYYRMYRDVARDRNLQVIDHEPHWGAIQKSDPALFKRYMPDGLHPNTEGCREVILPELLKALGLEASAGLPAKAPKP